MKGTDICCFSTIPVKICENQILKVVLALKDASGFLRKIKPLTEVNSYLATLDKITLHKHPNFRRYKNSKIISWKFYEGNNIHKGKNYFLSSHSFLFNSKHLLQIKGFTMGTFSAPSYTNLFLNHFERKYIYSFIKGKSWTYFR